GTALSADPGSGPGSAERAVPAWPESSIQLNPNLNRPHLTETQVDHASQSGRPPLTRLQIEAGRNQEWNQADAAHVDSRSGRVPIQQPRYPTHDKRATSDWNAVRITSTPRCTAARPATNSVIVITSNGTTE